jgi:hypothetical protein
MKKDTIFQFVCFETSLRLDEFLPQWERFAEKISSNRASAISLHQLEENKNKFRYVSKNEWPSNDFQFLFQKGKVSEKFLAGQVKVVQAGGYSPVQIEQVGKTAKHEIKIIAFISDHTADINFYKELKTYHFLNIFEAYYENSLYAYVLEFFVKEKDAAGILEQLKKHHLHIEAGTYKECVLEHA